MTHYINFATVADSIKTAVTAAGVTVLDIDEIPDTVTVRDTPLLSPRVDVDFVTDFSIARDSMGSASAAHKTVFYTLNYRLFYQKVGTNRNTGAVYSGFMTTLGAILINLTDNDGMSGVTDLTPRVTRMGVLEDATMGKCHAADISMVIEQFMEVAS